MIIRLIASILFAAAMASAQPYSATLSERDGVEVVRLEDRARDINVSIAPTIGNNAFEMLVRGQNVFWFPYDSLKEFAAKPRLVANPLLWPWANRLDRDGFFANGRLYRLDPELGNINKDAHGNPIHGLLSASPLWTVVSMDADEQSATVTSRLEYHRHPLLAAQFPFAHVIEMTYRLTADELEVRTRIENLSAEALPLSLGYHPYFQIHDAPREEWNIRIPARVYWKLNDKMTPTGETASVSGALPSTEGFPLQDRRIDHVFGDLIRSEGGLAKFSLTGKKQRIEVAFGENYPIAVVYAPDRPIVCFEPMTAITNGANLFDAGRYPGFPSIAPGDVWEASYYVRVSGF